MSKGCLSYWVIVCVYKEYRMPKNWCLQTVVLETSQSPLDSKEIKSVNLKGDQPWIFTRKTDAEAEALVFWLSDVNRLLIGKSLMLGKIEGRRRRGRQRLKWLDSITGSVNMNLVNSGRWWGMWRPGELQFMGLQRVGHDWATEQQ